MSRPRNARWLLLAGITAALQGCVTATELHITAKGFNPRLRGDLQELETAQITEGDLGYGLYRTSPAGIISPTIPIVSLRGDDGTASRMMQSDCLWLSHEGRTGRGDRLQLRWEETMDVEAIVDGDPVFLPARMGLCTGTDPITRMLSAATDGTTPVEMAQSGLEAGTQQVFVSGNGSGLRVSESTPAGDSLILACSAEPVRNNGIRVYCSDQVRAVRDVQLIRETPMLTPPDSELCAATAVSSLGTVMQKDEHNFNQTLLNDLYAASCALDASVFPPFDTVYGVKPGNRFVLPGETVPLTPQLLTPRIRVVDGNRAITRMMRQRANGAANDVFWSVQTRTGGNGLPRWQENFLPSIEVTEVTLWSRDDVRGVNRAIDAEPAQMPPLEPLQLCMENAVGACAYRCAIDMPAVMGTLRFPIDRAHCVDGSGNPARPDVSPSYNNVLLDSANGLPQNQPLIWRTNRPITTLPTGNGLNAYLTFNLHARLPGGAALRAAEPAIDMSATRVGQFSTHATRIRNEGDVALRIERVEVIADGGASSRPENFSVLLPGREVPVPLPVDFVPQGKRLGVTTGIGFDAQPLYSARAAEHGIALHRRNTRNAKFSLYDQAFSVIDGLVVTTSPDYNFQLAGQRDFQRRNPTHAEYAAVGRALSFNANSLLELPTVLEPGKEMRVHLTHAPLRAGAGSALLRVYATPTNGTQQPLTLYAVLRGHGMNGPQLEILPGSMRLPRARPTGPSWRAGVAVVNVGDQSGKVQSVAAVGPDAARFTVTASPRLPTTLGAGEGLNLEVVGTPRGCGAAPQAAQAELEIRTEGAVAYRIPLAIDAEPCQ